MVQGIHSNEAWDEHQAKKRERDMSKDYTPDWYEHQVFELDGKRKDRTQYTIHHYLAEAEYPHRVSPDTYVYCDTHDHVRVIAKRDRTSVPIDEYESVGYVSRFLWSVYP